MLFVGYVVLIAFGVEPQNFYTAVGINTNFRHELNYFLFLNSKLFSTKHSPGIVEILQTLHSKLSPDYFK